MVFEDDKKDYIQFMNNLEKIDLSDYENQETTINSKNEEINQWLEDYFNAEDSIVANLKNNLFYIASVIWANIKKNQHFSLLKIENIMIWMKLLVSTLI